MDINQFLESILIKYNTGIYTAEVRSILTNNKFHCKDIKEIGNKSVFRLSVIYISILEELKFDDIHQYHDNGCGFYSYYKSGSWLNDNSNFLTMINTFNIHKFKSEITEKLVLGKANMLNSIINNYNYMVEVSIIKPILRLYYEIDGKIKIEEFSFSNVIESEFLLSSHVLHLDQLSIREKNFSYIAQYVKFIKFNNIEIKKISIFINRFSSTLVKALRPLLEYIIEEDKSTDIVLQFNKSLKKGFNKLEIDRLYNVSLDLSIDLCLGIKKMIKDTNKYND